ncbi:hard-surface inducible, partial [Fusarium coicis]
CGYLAKYAQDRFAALDADYHFYDRQIKGLKIEIENINKTKGELTISRDTAIAKAEKLQEGLDKALKDGEGLQEEIARLNKVISDDKLKDAEALKILEKTRADLKASQEQCSKLQAEVAQKDAQIAEQGVTITNLQNIIITLETTIAQHRAEISVRTSENEKLAQANATLEGKKRDLEGSVKDLQEELERAYGRINDLQDTAKSHATKDQEIRDAKAHADVAAAKSEREAAKALGEVEKYKRWAFDNKVKIDLSKY